MTVESLSTDHQQGLPARTVLVTGAGKGLGAAFAMAIGREGANVVVNNRRRDRDRPPSADLTVQALKSNGGRAVAEYSDIADDGAAERLVGAAIDHYGGLDAIVCNAGISGEAMLFENGKPESFASVMEINFHANVRLAAAALPHLKKSSAGRIVFVSSSAGLHGSRGLAAYAASKGALNAFALTLADELRRYNIGVNILCPFAATKMTAGSVEGPYEAVLDPAFTAPVAAWLTGPDCLETGETWIACAGRVRRARLFEGEIFGPERTDALSPAWMAANAGEPLSYEGGYTFRDAQDGFKDIFANAISLMEGGRT